jgi:hypothetical protein
MTQDGEMREDEVQRLRELHNKLDKEARKRTEALWKDAEAFGEMWVTARKQGKEDPREKAAMAELEKRRMEIRELWIEIDRIVDLLRTRNKDSWTPPWKAFDPHRTSLGSFPPTPEAQAAVEESRRRWQAMDKLWTTLMAHRMAFADLEATEAGAPVELETQRESVKVAIKELETEIKGLAEIDSPGCGESVWLMENWREILGFEDQKEFIDLVTRERDLILERVMAGDEDCSRR